MASGFDILFSKEKCNITYTKDNTLLASIQMTVGRLFPLQIVNIEIALCAGTTLNLWHRRYCHLNHTSLPLLRDKHLVEGLTYTKTIGPCKTCSLRKQTKKIFPKGQDRRAEMPLQLIHADLIGPMQTLSLGGNSFVFMLTDDYSLFSWSYFLSNKSGALKCFINFKTMMEKQLNHTLKVLRTDWGGEFTSRDFGNYYEVQGIR